jgi:ribosomal protein S12 methylthiotransferase accessory factor
VTHERLKHLVSPITGIVAELKPIAEDERGRYSVWMASHALPGTGRGLADLRVSLANKSAGKGRTSTQARTSALCEAIERISMGFTGHEPRRRARLTGLGKAAIHPNDCMLLSEAQYATREERNAVRGGDWIPERFDPERPCDWTEVAVIAPEGDDAASRFLPTALCYLGAPDPPPSLVADSNGNAAGNTLEEAILQGFFELVERDAVAIWWYNRRVPRCVDLEGEGDPYLLETAGVYAERGHDFRLLEITSDLGIPVYAAVSRRFDPDEAIFGFGAHPDPLLAMHRAATELNQLLFVSQRPSGRGRILADPAVREPWIEGAPAAGAPFVIPDAFRSTSGKELVRASAALVHGKGLEFLVLDQTRPGIGFPVVKVIVPGLRPINPRFAPGRLYAGPDRGESDLNPLPVPR